MMFPYVVCLEGNIGCGKSTVLGELRRRGYTCFSEPLSDWKYVFGPFAVAPASNCFALQVQIAASFAQQRVSISDLRANSVKGNVVFVERSFASHATFVSTAVANGWLNSVEHQCLLNLVSAIRWDPELHIFIDVDSKLCLRRIKQRSRSEETHVGLPRLEQIRAAHVSAGLLAHSVGNSGTVGAVADRILDLVATEMK